MDLKKGDVVRVIIVCDLTIIIHKWVDNLVWKSPVFSLQIRLGVLPSTSMWHRQRPRVKLLQQKNLENYNNGHRNELVTNFISYITLGNKILLVNFL